MKNILEKTDIVRYKFCFPDKKGNVEERNDINCIRPERSTINCRRSDGIRSTKAHEQFLWKLSTGEMKWELNEILICAVGVSYRYIQQAGW